MVVLGSRSRAPIWWNQEFFEKATKITPWKFWWYWQSLKSVCWYQRISNQVISETSKLCYRSKLLVIYGIETKREAGKFEVKISRYFYDCSRISSGHLIRNLQSERPERIKMTFLEKRCTEPVPVIRAPSHWGYSAKPKSVAAAFSRSIRLVS